jgi:hypothetical protein
VAYRHYPMAVVTIGIVDVADEYAQNVEKMEVIRRVSRILESWPVV